MMNLIQKIKVPENLELDKKKIILIALICGVFLYLDFSLFLSKQLKKAGRLKAEIVSLRNELDKLNKDLAAFQQIKNRQVEADDKPGLKNKKLIRESEIVNLLQEVSTLANKNNVQIEQMKSARESQPVTLQNKFVPVSVTLDLVADYHRFGKFINDLEDDQIFIVVQSFKISPYGSESLKQKVSLVLRTYVTK